MAYSTDLTTEEFKVIEPLLPTTYLSRRPPKWSKHQILNGIFYQLVNGCKWADLPRDLPPYSTVYYWFKKWKEDGTWEKISKEVFIQSRTKQGKKELPTLLLLDSQAVDNTDTGRNKGFCHYKKTNGMKRHLCTDVLGNILFAHCTPANITDDKGLIQIIKDNLKFFKKKKVNTPKVTVLLDNGYHKPKLEKELQKIYPQIFTKIRIKITPKPTTNKENPGFKPVHKRWVIDRTNAWVEKCRILWKNCEKLIETSVAKLHLCTIRLQIKRLVRG
jgi:transposase